MATVKQAEYIKTLATERGYVLDINPIEFEVKKASEVIDMLLKMPKAFAQPKKPEVTIADGIYFKDGVVSKVQTSKETGKKYAKVLNPETEGWNYKPGYIHRLTEADLMSLTAAKEFGKQYGVCAICGRLLSNKESIEAGIGPICAGKF